VILALGFGVFLMSTLYQVQKNLLNTLDLKMGQARANVVFFDVQEDQAAGLDTIVARRHDELIEQTPLVVTRIAAINGHSTSDLLAQAAHEDTLVRAQRAGAPGARRGGASSGRRSAWPLRREYRSTYRDVLAGSEKLTAGRWIDDRMRDSTALPWISVEQGVAKELRLSLGDTVTWNVEGVRVATVVTSFREVNFARFEPNFFVVFDPRALQRAPKQFVLLVRASGGTAVAELQRDAVAKYPNVSSLDLSLVQHTVMDVLARVTMAVRFLALISLALGIPVLFSAVAATRRDRLREGVLFKVLGATRRQIGRIMLAEYALLGALGSIMGVVLSVLGAWALMHWVFSLSFTPAIGPAVVVAVAMIAIAVAIGLLTGREVFAETPMAALRES
jgi:putative ABC transport system permease protein